MFIRMVPFVFVVLWASGFVGARLGLQYAEPATLLTIRMLANVVLFALIVIFLRRRVPTGAGFWHAFVVGLLIHGFYLGGSYVAIGLGMPSGLCSLLVGTQPIVTAVLLVSFANQHFSKAQWFGLALGFLGISLVLLGKMEWQSDTDKVLAVGVSVFALIGITLGTLYQKRYCHDLDMVGSALVQYFAALLLFLPYALMFETMTIQWEVEFVLTLGWLVIVLSCAAVLLLLYMVKHGAASSVASVFYLVPPVTAIQAWLMFGESLDAMGILGFILAAFAVYLVTQRGHKPSEQPVLRECGSK
ncbi:multidrug transporter [Vibrio caribbeanicus]|uniref:Multidrug transporter n=1 Tax=Vibrio caribbeanicus TaxID=701175 RepID=A0ACC4NYW2_9VIBR|nr:DMT family transporter [Vibrio caribbeanicus]KHD25647.1 multidrug transporter [Vibrio caribbeanicus]